MEEKRRKEDPTEMTAYSYQTRKISHRKASEEFRWKLAFPLFIQSNIVSNIIILTLFIYWKKPTQLVKNLFPVNVKLNKKAFSVKRQLTSSKNSNPFPIVWPLDQVDARKLPLWKSCWLELPTNKVRHQILADQIALITFYVLCI